MVIYGGVRAAPARCGSVMQQEHIPRDAHRRYAGAYRVTSRDPAGWVSAARAVGMRCMVVTARRHDLLGLLDSAVSSFTATTTGIRRNLFASSANACHASGTRIGLHYSLMD